QLFRSRHQVAAVVRVFLAEPEPDRGGGEFAHLGLAGGDSTTLPNRTPRAGTRASVPSFFRTKYVSASSSHRSNTPIASEKKPLGSSNWNETRLPRSSGDTRFAPL